jgi:hypothetical protein
MARAVVLGLWLAAAAALGAAAVACASRLNAPSYGPHTSSDTVLDVPSPPPEPVQVEDIEPSPDPRAVWIDGSWVWRTRRWVWTAGSWQLPPAGAYYARPSLIRLPVAIYDPPDGGVPPAMRGYAMSWMYIPGHWHLPNGTVVPTGQVVAPAASRP